MLNDLARTELRDRIRQAAQSGDATAVLSQIRRLMAASGKPIPDANFCSSALDKVSGQLAAEGGFRRLKTYIVRSVTLEPMLPTLKVEAAMQGFLLELRTGDYGSYLEDPIDPVGALAQFEPDLVFFVLELEDVAGDLAALDPGAVVGALDRAVDLVRRWLHGLRRFSSARVVFQGFGLPDCTPAGDVGDANFPSGLQRTVQELNARLMTLCRSVPDCAFFDVDRIAARVGRAGWRDERLFLSSRLPVAPVHHPAYVRGLLRTAAPLFRAPRKVLCTDLDNTLWGGILGEDGPEGIATGSAFPGNCFLAYQKYLKRLTARGVLLAIVSKNNPADVEEAFTLRSADLALSLQDFAARKIGWGDKTAAIRELAAEISLGLDAFVFVDDNPVECEAVQRGLPEVATVCVPPQEPWRYVQILTTEPFFDALDVTEADANRTELYQAQARRAGSAGEAGNREDFLRSLGIVCTFLPAVEAPLARAVQLLGKTNQFNLTTRRHGASEVQLFQAEGQALAVRVRDRFGDLGVVGLALLQENKREQTWTIDSLLLSCRVIGRGVETALLAELVQRAQTAGIRQIVGEYIPSAKNSPCADFYPKHGFVEQARGTQAREPRVAIFYHLDLATATVTIPSWIEVEGNLKSTAPEEMDDRESILAHVAS